jgi:hypothetical protein
MLDAGWRPLNVKVYHADADVNADDPGSTGRWPVLFGSLPKSPSSDMRLILVLLHAKCPRQDAEDCRLGRHGDRSPDVRAHEKIP